MKKSVSLFLFTLLFSCTPIEDSKVAIPDNILSEEKMASVMVDIHLLEAALNISTVSKDNIAKSDIEPTTDLMKKNGITKKQFDESFVFYSQHPNLLVEVYQLVMNDLSKMQAEVMSKK